MDPAQDDRSGVVRARATVPAPGRTRTQRRPAPVCRWCGAPAAWSWTVVDDDATVAVEWPRGADCLVCAECQALTLGADDTVLLDRVTALVASRVPFPYASAFVREQQAAALAHWIARRTTFRPC